MRNALFVIAALLGVAACGGRRTGGVVLQEATCAYDISAFGDPVVPSGDGKHAWIVSGAGHLVLLNERAGPIEEEWGPKVRPPGLPLDDIQAFANPSSLHLWYTINNQLSLAVADAHEVAGVRGESAGEFPSGVDVYESPSGTHAWIVGHSGGRCTVHEATIKYSKEIDDVDVAVTPHPGFGECPEQILAEDEERAWIKTSSSVMFLASRSARPVTIVRAQQGAFIWDVSALDDDSMLIVVAQEARRFLYVVSRRAPGRPRPIGPDLVIRRYATASDPGRIWVATEDHVYIIDVHNDARTAHSLHTDAEVDDLWAAAEGGLWVTDTNSRLWHVARSGKIAVSDDVAEHGAILWTEVIGQTMWLLVGQTRDDDEALMYGPRDEHGAVFRAELLGDAQIKITRVRDAVTNFTAVLDGDYVLVGARSRSGDIEDVQYFLYKGNGTLAPGRQPVLIGPELLAPIEATKPATYLSAHDEAQSGRTAHSGLQAVAATDYLKDVKLTFPSVGSLVYRIGSTPSNRPLTVAALQGVKIEADLLDEDDESRRRSAKVQVQFFDRRNRLVAATPKVSAADFRSVPAPLAATLSYHEPYTVVLTYEDDIASAATVTWRNVTFDTPWFQRPVIRTAAVLLVSILAGILLSAVPWGPITVRRWIPALILIATGSSAFMTRVQRFGLDGDLFALFASGVGAVGIAIGIARPAVLRTLARAEPFHAILKALLATGVFRRRYFRSYVHRANRELAYLYEKTHNERYVELPAAFSYDGDQRDELVPEPATRIAALFKSTGASVPRVLIEAPGGRGKTALLRNVITKGLDDFLTTGRARLPLLCTTSTGESIRAMVERTLGTSAVSPEIVEMLLTLGAITVVIDGVTESRVTADMIRDFLGSREGEATALLASARPRADVYEVFQAMPGSVLVEPQRLSEATYASFERAYASLLPNGRVSGLSPEQKQVCRARDGTYSPILVRLALLTAGTATNVAELYGNTLRTLLLTHAGAQTEPLIDEAAQLCVETYWKTGDRLLAFSQASEPRRRLLRELLNADIVIAAGIEPYVQEPREVRFFHDSMQSYLAAKGLFISTDDWSNTLHEAAGHPRFVDAERDEGEGPEVFQMCLSVFSPEERLQRVLAADLRKWADDYGDILTIRLVTTTLETRMPRWDPDNLRFTSPARALDAVVADCLASPETTRDLGQVYARIAPLTWRERIAAEERRAAAAKGQR